MTFSLVIALWIGSPAAWAEFRVPMESRAACHAVLYAKLKTPQFHRRNPDVFIWCEQAMKDGK